MNSVVNAFDAAGGLRPVAVCDWAELCERVAEIVQDQPAGPLELDLVAVPSAGHQRSLSQALARRAGGPQLTAGLEFVRLPALPRRLAQPLEAAERLAPDGWRGATLELAILGVVATNRDRPELAVLANHLYPAEPRAGRAHSTSTRIARLLRRYAHQAPQLVASWRTGQDVDAAGQPLAERDRWQPVLWRALRDLLGDDPAEVRQALQAELVAGPVPGLPQRIVVCQVDDPTSGETALLDALATHHQVHQISVSGVPRSTTGRGSSFLRQHASRPPLLDQWPAGRATTLLAQIQDEIRHDRSPSGSRSADGSVQIHACHGPDRQVEVLRDLLCGLFTDDPSLQPRDVVVLCPDLGAYEPLITASFCLDGTEAELHPGHRLRAQVSASSLAGLNPVLSVLHRLFELHAGRSTSIDLMDLCQLPPVARRFGFDDPDRLQELIKGAEIRWGMGIEQRRRVGVGISQSTWLAGVQRLLISLALNQQPPVALTTLTPVDGVTGPDAPLIGQLAELVSRVRKICIEFDQPASAPVWAERLRTALDLVVELAPADAWQLNHAVAELAELAEQGDDLPAQLAAGDLAAWLETRLHSSVRRPNYGNGSLLFTSLDDLAGVPARVVCVLGLDDSTFPGSPGIDGDDLLARPGISTITHWTSDRRSVNRQRLLDALLAAQERFVVITQGADEATGLQRPVPVCIAALLDTCAVSGPDGRWRGATGSRALVNWHPLHPHGWADFAVSGQERPFSFDRQGLQGALALADPTAGSTTPAWQWSHGVEPSDEVDLDELIAFFTNPARDLLRRATGTTVSQFSRALEVGLPIEQNSLTEWAIGSSIFESLVAGHDAAQATQSAWLSGRVLPGAAGQQVIDNQQRAAEDVATAVRAARAGQPRLVDCDVEVAGVRVRGRVRLHENRVVVERFGKLKPDDALACWLRLLVLQASGNHTSGLSGLLIGKGCYSLAAPAPDLARRLLAEMVRVRASGLNQVLPLPLRSAAAYVDLLSRRYGEPLERARDQFKDEDDNWSYFFAGFDELLAAKPQPGDPAAGAPSRFEGLAKWLLTPILDRLDSWRPDRSGHGN